MDLNKLGCFEVISQEFTKSIPLEGMQEGINNFDNFIIKYRDNKVEYIIDKVCDHAGGRLIIKENKAVCPMHNWILDLENLEYDNSHVCKAKIDFQVKDNVITVPDFKSYLSNPFKKKKSGNVTFRWINHAAVYFECNGVSIITDPWLFGPAFATGWWLAEPSTTDSIELLKNADYVYISHNHPDHLHPETLACLDREKKILVGNFITKSCENYLRKLGFVNVIALDFLDIIELKENFQISLLKSGDFRDDSGIYLNLNGTEFLLTVDANFLNNYILPQNIDFLCTSFAGGASGFPLCFSGYSEDEKKQILKRNRGAIKFSVAKYLENTNAKHYMPYAGMFKELSYRDVYIKENNIKNATSDYGEIAAKYGAKLLEPASNVYYNITPDSLVKQQVDVSYLQREDTKFYIDNLKEEYQYDPGIIANYFKHCKYNGKQIVQIIPTNDDFEPISTNFFYADFDGQIFQTKSLNELLQDKEEYRVMTIKIRYEVIMCIIENSLPWEDFAIGFQMRIDRSPNTYESDFWFHFTNVYIAKENFRYTSFCGSCTVINQNPIWNALAPTANIVSNSFAESKIVLQ